MTRALLDYPWHLDESLRASSAAFDVLRKFESLVRRFNLIPAPFIEADEYHQLFQRIREQPGGPRVAALLRFAGQLVRYNPGTEMATPRPTPPLSDSWKRALRAELDGSEDWRVPQVVYPRTRSSFWPTTPEIEILCDETESTVLRVLVCLDACDLHRYFIPDLDPWRSLEWIHAPAPMARISHPCSLPRPPRLAAIGLGQIADRLEEACHHGWKVHGRYHFIPPSDYKPTDVLKDTWRVGRAFAVKRTPDKQRQGPVDSEGRIWAWDANERHWDVQLEVGYVRVSHDGRQL